MSFSSSLCHCRLQDLSKCNACQIKQTEAAAVDGVVVESESESEPGAEAKQQIEN